MASELHVDAHAVGLTVRPPEGSGIVLLHLHGDRHLSGEPEPGLDLAGHLAVRTGAEVVCARYRPRFPVALADVRAAYEHCRAAGPVIVVGTLAGAGLATALLLQLRDEGARLPECAVLVSALLDLRLEAQSLLFNAAANPAFDVAELRRRVAEYACGAPRTDPLLSPLLGNLHGLPPVQVQTAGTDPLLDDSLAFAARAAHSGMNVNLHIRQDAAELRARIVPAAAAFIGSWAPSAAVRAPWPPLG
ncbi:Acetyl esterase/lipase [Thermomonospora echinospora]|uniref:Acetyl esterase/lipase n=1 Tax=Thermomonospora echinospora TaxID=1992 RepID=A0A1H6DGH5_9ACTN|nr:alpha/beta hydrolase fold domain-containing protein [Thermomonospora echinospora]SEG83706.1 Acetyl esterase/lipase [Thermomonospora echinospora]